MSNKPEFIPSPHHSNRNGQSIQAIIIHRMAGTLGGTINWFKNPESKVSAHYLIGQDGSITQMVRDSESAWHCGYKTGEYPKWLAEVNPNWVSIGIECEDRTSDDVDFWTKEQLNTLLTLCKILVEEYNIPLDRNHILGHSDVDGVRKPNCPGSHFPWDDFMRNLKDAVNEPITEKEQAEIVEEVMETDIPTEVEDEFKLKEDEDYDKHWTFREFIGNIREKTVGLPKEEEATKELEKLRNDKAELEKELKNRISSLETNIKDIRAGYDEELSATQEKAVEMGNLLADERDKNALLTQELNELRQEASEAFAFKKKMEDTMSGMSNMEKELYKLLSNAEEVFKSRLESEVSEEVKLDTSKFYIRWAQVFLWAGLSAVIPVVVAYLTRQPEFLVFTPFINATAKAVLDWVKRKKNKVSE